MEIVKRLSNMRSRLRLLHLHAERSSAKVNELTQPTLQWRSPELVEGCSRNRKFFILSNTQYAFIAFIALCATYFLLNDGVTNANPPGDGWIECAAEGGTATQPAAPFPSGLPSALGMLMGMLISKTSSQV